MRELKKQSYSSQYKSLFGLLIGIILLSACIGKKEKPEAPDPESVEILPEVVFSVIDDNPLQFYIESRGVVEPLERIQIIPRVSGFVEESNIKEGKRVNKGDILLRFNKEEWESREKEAHNQYLKTKREYDVEMRVRGGNSPDTSGYRITSGLADAELAWKRTQLELSYTTIKAPFSGYISTKEIVTPGAYIGAGKELGTLVNTSKVRIRFDVLESEISSLKPGMGVELEDPSGEKHSGTIVAISPEIDIESKTGQAVVEVDNPNNLLKTGMTVDGRVHIRSVEGKVRIPRSALLERDGRTLVFKLNGDEVEWIYVTPDAMNTEWVIINHEEINPGDTLAVDKHFTITHQQRILPLVTD